MWVSTVTLARAVEFHIFFYRTNKYCSFAGTAGDVMSKLPFILMFLALLSITEATSFERPWENRTWVTNNPYVSVYGYALWWHLPALSNTLNSLDFQDTQLYVNGSAKQHVENAIRSKEAAENNLDICTSTEGLSVLWAWETVRDGIIFAAADLIMDFRRVSGCMQYGNNWIGTVDSSLNAIEVSMEEAKRSISHTREVYKTDMLDIGLCNRNYTDVGSEDCAELQGAFNSIDNNYTEGKYGHYPLLLEYSRELDAELVNPIPDLSLFESMMALVWDENGALDSSEALRSKIENAKNSSATRLETLIASAEGRKQIVDNELAELRDQKVDLITEAPSSYEVRKPGSVRELYSEIVEKDDQISIEFEEMKVLEREIFTKGYRANAILGMIKVDRDYGDLVDEIEELEEYAQDVVDQQQDEAILELGNARAFVNSSARSSESMHFYNMAERAFDAGEDAQTWGEKFKKYYDAAAFARSAQSQRTFGEELDIKSSLSELDLLIQRAIVDEINVVTEQESCALLSNLDAYQINDQVEFYISNIILKARIKYDDRLMGARERVYDKLELAGPAAADLRTDLENFEEGKVVGGQISYPDAIGGLKQLSLDYMDLEEQLDQYMSDIVGTAMSVTLTPQVDSVWLDESSNIILDVVLTNGRDYGANNAVVNVDIPTPISFLYSDITYGSEDVESLYVSNGGTTAVFTLGEVKPFEVKRLVLEKQTIVAHTLNAETEAIGLGNDMAHVLQDVDFQLDIDIPRLSFPDDASDILIDGADPNRPLSAGQHTLTMESTVYDAYSEEIKNIKCYNLGTNSQVEFDIHIVPNIDLDRVPVFIYSVNDTRLSTPHIIPATGERVTNKRRLSETQYAVDVLGLQKGRTTILKVSYTVENTEVYVSEQIEQLESLSLGEGSEEMVALARQQAESGNYSLALETLEEARAILKQEEKQATKLQKKYSEYNKKLVYELEEVTNALASTNLTSPLIGKLQARKGELERLTEEIENSTLEEKVDRLAALDYKWLGKELNSLKKSTYKEYNNLKERFYLAGNSTTPVQFLEFESALHKLETGNRLEYAVQTLEALERVKSIVESQEGIFQSEKQSLGDKLLEIRSKIEDTLSHYSKEAASAKGTEYSTMFRESESKVKKLIREAEDSLDMDPRIFNIKLNSLEKSYNRMQRTLDSLSNESGAKLSLLETLLQQSDLGEEKKADVNAKITTMKEMFSAGEYVNALRMGSVIAEELDSGEPEGDNNLLLLGVTALAILAIIAAYIIKQQKKDGKKVLKKLERISGPKSQKDETDCISSDEKPDQKLFSAP